MIERERSQEERDGLRYYVDGKVEPLWEQWFYCYDLGVQLGPVIKRYFESEEHRTGKPPAGEQSEPCPLSSPHGHTLLVTGKVFPTPPVKIDTATTTHTPFSLHQVPLLSLLCCNLINNTPSQWIDDNAEEIREKGSKQLFGSGEFKVSTVMYQRVSRVSMYIGMTRTCL